MAQEQKPTASASGGVAVADDAKFRIVRSVSGTKVNQQEGRSIVEDPRTVFYAPADSEVIVYFTWEGPTGPHKFEGNWKNPSGKVVVISDFEYQTHQPRFGGYFRMLLGTTPAAGVWTLEARIDGEAAGSHAFQIVASPRPDNVTSGPTRRLLSPSEIYARAESASVIENFNAKATLRNVGTGFFIGPGKMLTAFQVIDGATKVRVKGPQGQSVDLMEVVAWNRRQDWIILKVALDNVAVIDPVAEGSWTIGDQCYVLDSPAEGNRVVIETSLIGKQSQGTAGERLNIGDTVNRRAVGSPVLNEYGEVIGLVGGNLLPGAAFLEDLAFAARNNHLGVTSRGTLAIPINLINELSETPTTISGLASSGQFMPALVNNQAVLSGSLARTINKKSNPPRPIDERIEFSRSDSQGTLLITWLPTEKRKGKPSLRLYDLDNRLINENESKKRITINPQKISYSTWDFNLGTLPAGIYRFDVAIDGDIVWRTFFRMVE